MSDKITGKCKYCGKEYTRPYIMRHLASCKKRAAALEKEQNDTPCGYYELFIYGKYENAYWMVIEIKEDDTLRDLDQFLRDIWLECCGHLSSFFINGVLYDSMLGDDMFFYGSEPNRSMKDYQLKEVLKTEMKILYQYDFGSTTELVIEVRNYRKGFKQKEDITILSRNNPPVYMCSNCGKKPAVFVCPSCIYEGEGLLCKKCAKKYECDEDILLPVCNSPRMGVCGYEGSTYYPDQFVSDCEENVQKDNKQIKTSKKKL